jgi:hypothetical protein
METSELYLLFNSLSANEITEFGAYLQNAVTSSKGRYRGQMIHLYELLRNRTAAKEATALDKDWVFKIIFPEQNVTMAQLERVMHELLQELRQYLLTDYYYAEANNLKRQIHYASILASRNIENKALIPLAHTLRELDGLEVRAADHFTTAFEAAWQQYSISSQSTKWKDDLQISAVMRYLDLHYLCYKLQLLNHYLILNANSKVNQESTAPFINTNIEINPGYLNTEPYLNILYKVYLLLMNPTPSKEGFRELKDLLNRYESAIDATSIKTLYSYLRNYCTLLIRAGSSEFYIVLFELMQDNLEKGYFFYEGKLSLGGYLNIANMGLRVGAMDWVYAFAQQYRTQTQGIEDEKEITYQIIMASYYHRGKNLNKALEYLPQASQILMHNLFIKALEIMIYYDMGDELFQYKSDAFKMHISRSSKKLISDEVRDLYANFINFLSQISNTMTGDRERAQKIESRIHAKTHIAEREWLLKKVAEKMIR